MVARIIGLRLRQDGTPSELGMIVSNHLSYLDIIAYSALTPCVFVAKREVASWPVLGLFARMAGTIFVDRTRRMTVADTNSHIADALRAGVVVMLFPEGTSSGGFSVLPFRSSLLEAAALAQAPLAPAAIQYDVDDGSVPEDVCYWRDMTLLPHLLKLFSKRSIEGRVVFGAILEATGSLSRKDAARQLHQMVLTLHARLSV